MSVIEESLPHGPVALKEQDHQHEYDPDSIEIKILKKELHAVRVAQKIHTDLVRGYDPSVQDKAQEISK